MRTAGIAILCLLPILLSLGCSTEEVWVDEFNAYYDREASTVTLTCRVHKSYETGQVSIRGWFEISGDVPLFEVGGPETYSLYPGDSQEVQFVLSGIPEFDDACWGFDWAKGTVDGEGHDAYRYHHEEKYR